MRRITSFFIARLDAPAELAELAVKKKHEHRNTLSARICFPYHRQAKDVLATLDLALALDPHEPPIVTFARLCFQSLGGEPVEALGQFSQILERLATRCASLSPRKPRWLTDAELVLHLGERLLGQSPGKQVESQAATPTQVHRTRRQACGTYSSPNYIADRLCAAVFAELRRSSRGSRPVTMVDLSAEAGHFVLAARSHADRPPVEFLALDRDPEAISLLGAIQGFAASRCSRPAFDLDARVADSIVGNSLSSRLGTIDAVIGNPPWKTMHPTDERAYAERYGSHLRGRFDVCQAFMLRADELLRPGGLLAVTVPSALLYTDNAREVRRYLLDKYQPIWLGIYPRRTFVELPSVAPIVLVLRKKRARARGMRKLDVSVYRSLNENPAPARSFRLQTREAWPSQGRAVWSVSTIAPERFTALGQRPTIRLSELGMFSSGAKLSSTKRVETDADFYAAGGKAVCPFFLDRSACDYHRKGAAAFDRRPRTDLIGRSKVLFQTVRCVSMPRRLIAAVAGPGELACSTAAMLVPQQAAHSTFLAGLLNASFVNAWYKARDHHHAIKISVLRDLTVPQDDALWREIGLLAGKIGETQRRLHEDRSRCGALCTKDQTAPLNGDLALLESMRALDELVFELYQIPTSARAEFDAFSALDCF
jgi:hypothetical protein